MKRQSLRGSRTAQIVSALLVLLVFSFITVGQQGTSSVRGVVKDQQGNVVAGAVVTLINVGTSVSRTATTSENGAFTFESVPIGDYKVECEAKGFKKGVVTDVHALVSKPTSVEVQLEIGQLTEVVTISAGSAELLVNKEDATLGNNFVSQQITQLPLEARNVHNLLTLQPGSTRDGRVTGARSDQSNITLDGVDINEAQTNQVINPNADPANGTDALNLVPDRSTVIRLNAEAIEEFRVTTSNPNANQGRSSGAQVSLVTKSGSNNWHGALFWANRNTATSANNFLNNRSGLAKPKLIRNTYGGAVGGPIIKDKFFFFYSYEGRKDVSQTSVTRTVPLASLGRGELRYVNPSGGITTLTTAQLTTIFPAAGINPIAVAALAS